MKKLLLPFLFVLQALPVLAPSHLAGQQGGYNYLSPEFIIGYVVVAAVVYYLIYRWLKKKKKY